MAANKPLQRMVRAMRPAAERLSVVRIMEE